MGTITCGQLRELSQSASVQLIDVRTPMEFAEVHVQGAINVPLDQLDPAAVMAERNGSAEQPLYVICRSGSRGKQACSAFEKAGFTNVLNVEGGTLAWDQCGFPVIRSQRKVISLERQVRIAAGFLVVTGVILSVTVHPWFVALSGFVGAGLMFAGITDTCGMGLLLARMPWNRVSGCQTK
ncbi:MAG: rhodanese-like domain-containing protein [Planctomycetaceae bacterium]|nr:rhodanese-like domain-containing protein [Planctomycetaceae bacterium]